MGGIEGGGDNADWVKVVGNGSSGTIMTTRPDTTFSYIAQTGAHSNCQKSFPVLSDHIGFIGFSESREVGGGRQSG